MVVICVQSFRRCWISHPIIEVILHYASLDLQEGKSRVSLFVSPPMIKSVSNLWEQLIIGESKVHVFKMH